VVVTMGTSSLRSSEQLMEHSFEAGDIVEILPCPYAETFGIVGKTAKVIELLSFSDIIVKIKVKMGNSIFFLHPMELKKKEPD